MRQTAVLMCSALVWLLAPAASDGMDSGAGRIANIDVLSTSYAPGRISVLTGDTVTWTVADRFHTVSADDDSWSSARLYVGDSYSHRFTSAGAVGYYCQIHAFMHGEVDVSDILLDPAAGPASPRRPYPLRGRAALAEGTTVSIEADSGHGFARAASATVGADGTFTAMVRPATTTTYRAVNASTASPPIVLRVLDHTVQLTDLRRGRRDHLTVHVTPSSPGSTVVLQLYLRERFGWWPEAQRRLNGHSQARFVLALGRAVRARVALTLPDGATQLAVSKTVQVGASR